MNYLSMSLQVLLGSYVLDLVFMVDLGTTVNFTGSVVIILILQILRRRKVHHCSAQIVEFLIWSCNV